MKAILKKCIQFVFSLFGKKHLLELWQIKKYEPTILPYITNFYAGFIYPEMKIIDVGANVGNYSKVFVNCGAQVIGIEPQQYCQNLLKARFLNNKHFKLIPKASGSKISIAKIHKTQSHTIASMNPNWIEHVKKTNRFSGENWNTMEEVTVTTLDTIINDNFLPNYIKIDVEGFELEVLKGLTKAVDYISFEITLPETKNMAIDCVNEICRIGNYVFAIPNNNQLADITIWQTKQQIMELLETLSQSSTSVSSDIFCKKVN